MDIFGQNFFLTKTTATIITTTTTTFIGLDTIEINLVLILVVAKGPLQIGLISHSLTDQKLTRNQ